MKRYAHILLIVFIIMACGCNIVPKSVQYQKQEQEVIGDTEMVNPRVEEIQVMLAGLGYDTGNTDGRMGQETREAIKEFQESKGLKSTGYVDMNTWRQIEDIRRVKDEDELKKDYTVEVRSPYSEEVQDSQDKLGITTKEIQLALKNAGFDPGAIDGKMGPRTQQAVKEFQKTKGLTPDGVVGPKTWTQLSSYLKK